MWDFLSHIATLGVVTVLWLRLEPRVVAIMAKHEYHPPALTAQKPPIEDRSPRNGEAKVEDEEIYESIPQELYQLAMQESESWAREQSLAAMIQLKQRLKSWDRVRAFYGAKDIN